MWSTLPVNEKKLNAAFRSARSVILIFSVRESGKFQGKDHPPLSTLNPKAQLLSTTEPGWWWGRACWCINISPLTALHRLCITQALPVSAPSHITEVPLFTGCCQQAWTPRCSAESSRSTGSAGAVPMTNPSAFFLMLTFFFLCDVVYWSEGSCYRRELPFTKTAHLSNPWNEHKPVKIGRDGQVRVCWQFWSVQGDEKLMPVTAAWMLTWD